MFTWRLMQCPRRLQVTQAAVCGKGRFLLGPVFRLAVLFPTGSSQHWWCACNSLTTQQKRHHMRIVIIHFAPVTSPLADGQESKAGRVVGLWLQSPERQAATFVPGTNPQKDLCTMRVIVEGNVDPIFSTKPSNTPPIDKLELINVGSTLWHVCGSKMLIPPYSKVPKGIAVWAVQRQSLILAWVTHL